MDIREQPKYSINRHSGHAANDGSARPGPWAAWDGGHDARGHAWAAYASTREALPHVSVGHVDPSLGRDSRTAKSTARPGRAVFAP
jgi:hypothetical protein